MRGCEDLGFRCTVRYVSYKTFVTVADGVSDGANLPRPTSAPTVSDLLPTFVCELGKSRSSLY